MEVPLSIAQEALLEEVAARHSKSKAAVAAEAIGAYLNHEQWFRDAVEQGRAAARRGQVLEHDEVVRQTEDRFSGR